MVEVNPLPRHGSLRGFATISRGLTSRLVWVRGMLVFLSCPFPVTFLVTIFRGPCTAAGICRLGFPTTSVIRRYRRTAFVRLGSLERLFALLIPTRPRLRRPSWPPRAFPRSNTADGDSSLPRRSYPRIMTSGTTRPSCLRSCESPSLRSLCDNSLDDGAGARRLFRRNLVSQIIFRICLPLEAGEWEQRTPGEVPSGECQRGGSARSRHVGVLHSTD